MAKQCSVEDCDKPSRNRGWCSKHYTRWRRYGSPDTRLRMRGAPVEDRFWSYVANGASCWQWTGTINGSGYGTFSRDGKPVGAHRVAYELLVGPIPEGAVIDHLCRNRACVNPEHLEPVATLENLLRGKGFVAVHARKTHCPQGHPYDEENTYRYRTHRSCLTCRRQRAREVSRSK